MFAEWWSETRYRLRALLKSGDMERELQAEIEHHLEREAERLRSAGVAPTEAMRRARLAFGGVEATKEASRDARGLRLLTDVAQDLRQSLHLFWRRPGLTVAGVLTMGLGIGASVTVFSFTDSIFRRPLPVAHADRLVRIRFGSGPDAQGFLSFAAYKLLREHARSFDAVIAHYSTAPLYITAGGESEEVQAAVVSGNYFTALGIRPRLGRFFAVQEDAVPDRDAVAVIGYGLWQRRFGGDPAAVGQTIHINDRDFHIIGVAPDGFSGVVPGNPVNEIWIPTMMFHSGYRWCDALQQQPPCEILQVLARRAPGVSLAAAQAEANTLTAQLAALSDPADSIRSVVLEPAVGVPGAQGFRDLVRLLTAVSTFLLVIACAGLSGLLLASGSTRQTELAIRTSLGASRPRLIRQLLTEGVVLVGAGAALGVAGSVWGVHGLMGFFGTDFEGFHHYFEIGLDARILIFAVALSLLAAVLLGISPAVQASRSDPAGRLKVGTHASARAREWLIGLQVAVSVVMLIAAVLLAESFSNLQTAAGGFDPRHVVALRVRPLLVGYTPARAQAFLQQAIDRLRSLPQVEDLAFAETAGPLWESAPGGIPIRLPTGQVVRGAPAQQVDFHQISPHFFETLAIPMLAGREFTDHDRPNTPHVAIVNDVLAQRLWPHGTALGQMVVLDTVHCQVVGVVRHYRVHTAIRASPAMAFVPYWQNDFGPNSDARLAVRVRGNAVAAIPDLRRAIASADASVPITETMSLVQQMSGMYLTIHLSGAVLLIAAALAICLSAIAVFGITAFFVAQSTREIGIRMAVGARPSDVVARFLGRGVRAAATGGVVGLAVALVVMRLLSAWLVGVRPLDPVAFVAATFVAGLSAALACYFPARRAAHVDPVMALRDY